MKRYFVPGLSLMLLGASATAVIWHTHQQKASAHCQVPCGIYDDDARLAALREDSATIAKAMAQISELAGKHDGQSLNQATRWVLTKEQHASNIITVVSEYFLTQKVKPVSPGTDGHQAYLQKLADHHAVLAAAMKSKQTVDSSAVDGLNRAIEQLAGHYQPAGETHAHAAGSP